MAIMLVEPQPFAVTTAAKVRPRKHLGRLVALAALAISGVAGAHVGLVSHATPTVPTSHMSAAVLNPGPLPSSVVLNGVADAIASR